MTDSEKIQWLVDREQIKETIFRYPVGIDTRDWKLFRSIFTDKIDILLSVASRADRPRQIVSADGFTKSADRLIAQVFAVTQHSLNNYQIDVKGDDATSLCYWCSTNERDGLGDNLPPDYVSRARNGDFFGWPWYYIGDHEDPGRIGERSDLRDKITVPDVLLQAHSASLEMAFYDGQQFPRQYQGDAFAAEHGSWNRASRTGYKIIRVIVHKGIPTGENEDFMTGFVIGDRKVWGRPVGIAVAHDGSLIVTEDGNSSLWRISYPVR